MFQQPGTKIDAPELATLVDATMRAKAYAKHRRIAGSSPRRGTDTPGVTFGLHLCRGNNAAKWMVFGGYDSIARHVFLPATRYSVLALEYDDHRSGDLELPARLSRRQNRRSSLGVDQFGRA